MSDIVQDEGVDWETLVRFTIPKHLELCPDDAKKIAGFFAQSAALARSLSEVAPEEWGRFVGHLKELASR